jgi:hypothetical protein
MLGRRPTASRPDARAVWDHACLQADHYLARRLHRLDDEALAELDARQQAILDNPPSFDPSELERTRQRLDAARATPDPRPGSASPEQLRNQRLERAAQAHHDWRRAATGARATRRQIALEQQRRRRELRTSPTAVRLVR